MESVERSRVTMGHKHHKHHLLLHKQRSRPAAMALVELMKTTLGGGMWINQANNEAPDGLPPYSPGQ